MSEENNNSVCDTPITAACVAKIKEASSKMDTRQLVEFVVLEILDTATALERDNRDLQQTFDLRWKADLRAIKMWREYGEGRELIHPDHADLVVFLLERIENMHRVGREDGHKIKQLEAKLAEARKDTQRLDWIDSIPKLEVSLMAISGTVEVEGYNQEGDDFCERDFGIRAAIDAVMESEARHG